MTKAPIYNIGQVVYLKESAALGFLEAYAIKSIAYDPAGRILYGLSTSVRSPNAVQTVGDRITGLHAPPLSFYEEDLILFCAALDLCIANLQLQLTNLQTLRSNCNQGTVG